MSDQHTPSLSSPSPASRPPRLGPTLLIRYGGLAGLGMVAVGAIWFGVLRGHSLAEWFPADGWLRDLGLGAGAGAIFALVVWRLMGIVPPLKRIEQIIVGALDMDALTYRHALVLGLIAGLPEEILFRGALQPVAGWLLTSVLFGALHAASPAYFAYAALAGGFLGELAIWRDGLWAPVAAHMVIDALLFCLMIRAWRQTHPPATPDRP